MKIGYREHTKIFLDITVHKTRPQSHPKKNTFYTVFWAYPSVDSSVFAFQMLPKIFFIDIKKIISMILLHS